jgi:hypothetical protein
MDPNKTRTSGAPLPRLSAARVPMIAAPISRNPLGCDALPGLVWWRWTEEG